MEHQCKHCGKEFISRNKNASFCSKKCYRQKRWIDNRPTINKKNCLFCGNEFQPIKSHKVFCSQNCQHRFFYHKNHPHKEKTCHYCGSIFYGNGREKYCDNCQKNRSKMEWQKRKDDSQLKIYHSRASRKYQKNHPEEDLARRIAHQKFKKETNGGYKSHSKYSHWKLKILFECPHDHPKKHNHHPDYSRLLSIERLCPHCHIERHKQLRQEQLSETA